jgi:hypothetical protein
VSYNILVVPEDPTSDHYILKPLIRAASKHAGESNAVITVMTDPAMKGVDQVLSRQTLQTVIARYPQVDLFLLVVDRDGSPARDQSLADHVESARQRLAGRQRLDGRTAWQELEVWCLAGRSGGARSGRAWREVRAEPHAKEIHFDPVVRGLSLAHSPGGGREILGRQAAKNYTRVRALCPELTEIEQIIRRP